MSEKRQIDSFSPEIVKITEKCNLPFNAGQEFSNFNSFLAYDVEDYFLNGDGVTYLIKNGNDVVAFYCISAGAIPYNYICENESQMWGISIVEIRMFAVDEHYQDVFFEYSGINIPIAAWCLKYIINSIQSFIGVKAIFLHSVPTAEKFYKTNGFQEMNCVMNPFHCIDEEFKPLWLPLQSISFGDGLANN